MAPNITRVGRVLVPVVDQDEAIAFYTQTLGFSLSADVPFGEGSRWVEVAPPGGGTTIALVPPQGEYEPGRLTGVSIESTDVRADYESMKRAGVDADEPLGGDGTVPLMFFFRDNSRNQLMVTEAR